MKTLVVSLGVLTICGFGACDRKSASVSLPTPAPAFTPSSIVAPEPVAAMTETKNPAESKPEQTTEAKPAPAPPSPPVEPEQTYADPIAASTVWQIVDECTDWSGKWVRQGNSNVFDSYITNKWNGENRHHLINVQVNGNVVTASHDDGTTYRGEISTDRTQIQGVQIWNGRTGNWIVRIDMSSLRGPVEPPKPRPAPEGVYFLLRSASITTDSGIVGLHPGTELHLLRDDGPTLHLSFGNAELDVNKTAVTNDLNVAEAAFANDAAAQANLAAWGQRQAAEGARQDLAKEKEAQAQRLAVEQATAPTHSSGARNTAGGSVGLIPYVRSPLVGNPPTSVANQASTNTNHRSGQDIDAQITRIERQNYALQEKLNHAGTLPVGEREQIESQIKTNQFNIDSLQKSKQ
jgi:uncharacterized membrane protein